MNKRGWMRVVRWVPVQRLGQLMRREVSGAAVLEIVLLIAAAVGLVLIFKTQLTALLNTIFGQIENAANSVF